MARKQETADVSATDMTPMIDMVFQLLIFFILMFKIVVPEGDFAIKMPVGGAGAGQGDPPQSVYIRLYANREGSLTEAVIGTHRFPATKDGFRDLQNYARTQLGAGGPIAAALTEIELDCDYNLKYTNVIRIISACTGYVDNNGKIVKLAEKIKFRAPRAPG